VMRKDHLVARSAQTGEIMAEMLAELVERHPSVGEVRSIGLFGAIELVRSRLTREPLVPFNGSSPVMDRLRQYLLDAGVFLYTHWNTLLLVPPLVITVEQLQEGFAAIDRALEIADASIE
jgi:taurine---2-oxoglutarate transaminase